MNPSNAQAKLSTTPATRPPLRAGATARACRRTAAPLAGWALALACVLLVESLGHGAAPALAAPGDRGINRFKNRDNNNDDVRRQVRRYEDEIAALNRQLSEIDSQIKSAKEQVDKAAKEAEPFLAKVEEAQQQLDAAKATMEEVRKAQNHAARDSQETQAELQSEVDKAPEMKEARAAYEAALTRHNTRRDALLVELRANPRYKVVVDELTTKRQQRDELAGKPGQSRALAELAEAVIKLEARIQELEREALAQAADWPAIEKARKESLEAMTAIRADLLRAIPDSPRMTAAKQALKDAADRATAAQKALQATQKTHSLAKSEAARSERKLAAAQDTVKDLEKRKTGTESLIARKRDAIRDLLRT